MFQGSLLLEEDVALDDCVVFYTDSRWVECLEEWKTSSYFGIDTEVYGEDHPGDGLNQWKGKIRLIQIGLVSERCICLDLGGIDGCSTPQHVVDEFFSILREVLPNPNILKIGQGFKYDALFFYIQYGIETRGIRDTMLMSQIYWAGLKSYRHRLDYIAERCGIKNVSKDEQTSEWWVPKLRNKQINYGCKDALVMIPIFLILGQWLVEAGLKDDAKVECECVAGFVEMEAEGMPVDVELLKENIKKYREAEQILLKPFLDEFPGVNPDSNKQLLPVLKKYLKKDIKSTEQRELAYYRDKPPIKSLLLSRSLRQLLQYQERMLDAYFDGAVRGIYNQCAPKGFGRSTCGDDKKSTKKGVNLQNPPNKLPDEFKAMGLPHPRSSFRCPEDSGRALISGDLSSAHARISADLSLDPVILAAYNSGLDMHSLTGSKLAEIRNLGKDWTPENIAKWKEDKSHPNQKVAKILRTTAKPTHYGNLNLQGADTLKDTVKNDADIDITKKEAQGLIKAWRETYKTLYAYQMKIIEDANNNSVRIKDAPYSYYIEYENKATGETVREDYTSDDYGVVRAITGRRLFMAKMKSKYKPKDPPSVKGPDAVAATWTMSESTIIKAAIVMFMQDRDKHPEWEAKLANLAHDEICVTSNKQYALDTAKSLQACMRAAMAWWIKSIPPDEMDKPASSLILSDWAEH